MCCWCSPRLCSRGDASRLTDSRNRVQRCSPLPGGKLAGGQFHRSPSNALWIEILPPAQAWQLGATPRGTFPRPLPLQRPSSGDPNLVSCQRLSQWNSYGVLWGVCPFVRPAFQTGTCRAISLCQRVVKLATGKFSPQQGASPLHPILVYISMY